MSVYSLYQITCGYTVSQEEFKRLLFHMITQYYEQKSVCITVNNILFGESMYSGKYPCPSEPVAMIFVSVNPVRTPEGLAPHIKWLADELALSHSQTVVLCSAISPADTTIVGKKP